MMRICHLTTFKLKDARIYYRMCYGLAELGLPAMLIAPEISTDDKIVRLSAWNGCLARTSRVRRIGLTLKAALTENADVYHIHEQELIPIGCALKILRPSAAIVFDAREDYPGLMRAKYWVPKPLRPLLALTAHTANIAACLCLDGVVTADPDVQNDFQRWRTQRTFVYYNFPTLSLFTPEVSQAASVKADLVYVGGMSDRTGIFVLLDALALLAKQGVKPSVRLAGYTDGEAGQRAIRARIDRQGLTAQVELRGTLPYEEVPAWIHSGRIGLVPLQPLPKFMKNISTKTFEYWACGLPVIASDLPPIRPFLRDGYNGVLFEPANAHSLAHAIRSLIAAPERCKVMGRNGQQQVYGAWNNQSQAAGLISFYEEICKK
jgi:glycosyltransferase involved in cell wall biosynthesis